MKNFSFPSFCIALFFLFIINSTHAQEKEELKFIDWGMEIAPQKMYLWHGISIDDGLVVQPDFWISIKDFTLELWGNGVLIDKSNYDSQKNHEIDLYFYYTYYLLENLEIVNGINYYNYIAQEESPSTFEFTSKIGIYLENNIKFTNEIFVDIYNYKGLVYSSHNIEYLMGIEENINCNLVFECGLGNKKFFMTYYNVSLASVSYFKFATEISFLISDNSYIAPFIEYNYIPVKSISEQIGNNFINAGMKLKVEF